MEVSCHRPMRFVDTCVRRVGVMIYVGGTLVVKHSLITGSAGRLDN